MLNTGMVSLYIPIWICIVLIIIFNVLILHNLQNADEAKWFTRQSFWYAAAFFVTWAPSTSWSAIQWNTPGGNFLVDVLAALFEPLWGLWNLLIFLHSHPKSRKRICKLFCCDFRMYFEAADDNSNNKGASKMEQHPGTTNDSHTDTSA